MSGTPATSTANRVKSVSTQLQRTQPSLPLPRTQPPHARQHLRTCRPTPPESRIQPQAPYPIHTLRNTPVLNPIPRLPHASPLQKTRIEILNFIKRRNRYPSVAQDGGLLVDPVDKPLVGQCVSTAASQSSRGPSGPGRPGGRLRHMEGVGGEGKFDAGMMLGWDNGCVSVDSKIWS